MPRPLAHLIAVLAALATTAGGLTLLSMGGMRIWQSFMRLDFGSEASLTGGGIQLAGVVLLVGAVLTGMWSPAGLLAVAGAGLVSIVLSAMPMVLIQFYSVGPFMQLGWVDSLAFGLPQTVCTVMGATGVVLALLSRASRKRRAVDTTMDARTRARTRDSGGLAAQAMGLVVSPLFLIGGLLLMLRGLGSARQISMIQAGLLSDPFWILALIGGFLLVSAAVVLARWSPFALVLPAVVIGIASALSFVPDLLLRLSNASPMMLSFMVLGGLPTAAVLLACSAVILVAWFRNRRASGAGYAVPAQHTSSGSGHRYDP